MDGATLDLFAPRTPPVLRPPPAVGALRYYQADAISSVLQRFEAGAKRQLVVLATGLGKTHLFCDVARRELETPEARVLVLVHRDKLLRQAVAAMRKHMPGTPIGIEKAEEKSFRERIIVASVQSLKPKRLARLLYWGAFTLVIADEAHHATAPSWRAIFDALPDAKRLGVTATPDRADGAGLAELFDSTPAYDMQIDRGITEGFLVPLQRHPVWLGQIDLTEVGTSAGDLKLGELDQAMLRAVEGIVQETLRLYPDGRGPVFLPGKASATMAAARFNALKPGCARVLTDDTDEDERTAIYRDIEAGQVQWLCNVNVATEGFDWPEANVVVLGRPTKSRTMYCQMVGRGTRTAAGCIDGMIAQGQAEQRCTQIAASPKPHCVVLDFVGNSGRHKLVTLTDLFGGGYTARERAKAAELEAKDSRSSKAKPAKHYLEEARKRLDAYAKRLRSKVNSHTEGASRMDVSAAEGARQPNPFAPATADQIAQLERAGWPGAKRMSAEEAHKAIKELKRRHAAGLATLKQLKFVANVTGISDSRMPFKVANAILNAYTANGKRLSRDQATDIARQMGYVIREQQHL